MGFHPETRNIIHSPLVDPSNIQSSFKALNKDRDCFEYLGEKFLAISDTKLKEGIFDGPQICTLFQEKNFTTHMNYTGKAAQQSLKNVSQKFWGNEKRDDYQNLVKDLLKNFKELGCLMNLKLHFLYYFPENLRNYSKEQGERFHQDIS